MILYKITPAQKCVEQVEYDGTYEGMRAHLKYEWLDHATLTRDGKNHLFVNDTGLLDGTEEKDGSFWWLHDNGEWQKFIGDAILWGTIGGENADPTLSLDQVMGRISYMKPNGAEEPNLEPEITTFDTAEEMIDLLMGR